MVSMNCSSNGYIGYVVIRGTRHMIINIWRARALPELNVKAPKTRISGILIYPVLFSVTDILRRILMKKKVQEMSIFWYVLKLFPCKLIGTKQVFNETLQPNKKRQEWVSLEV